MYYKSNLYCQTCKAWDKPLMKSSRGVSHLGIKQNYICRECNKVRVKNYYDNNTEKVKKIIARSIRKHKHKQNARAKLSYHVKAGNIIKPDHCEVCGASGRIEGHHTDYNKPLEVSWLCCACHADADRVENSKLSSKTMLK